MPPSGAPWSGWRVLFSRDSRRLAIARREDAEHIGLWDLRDDNMSPVTLGITPDENRPGVVDFAFSPDGRLLAVLSDKVTLWRLTANDSTPTAIDLAHSVAAKMVGGRSTVLGTPAAGNSVVFSSDGEQVLMLWGDIAVVWRTNLDAILDAAESAVARNMRSGEWDSYMIGVPYRKTFERLPIDQSVVEKLLNEIASQRNSTKLQIANQYRVLTKWVLTGPDSFLCNRVAWLGVLDGNATQVLRAADCAVGFAPYAAKHWDTRAMVRGFSGDTLGAADDIREFLKRSNSRSSEFTSRKQWLDAVQSGHNPFNNQMLLSLRGDSNRASP